MIAVVKPEDDYDKIMLSLTEKWILQRIMRMKQVPCDFCSEAQRDLFLKYNLIRIHQEQLVTSTGRVCHRSDAPKYIVATDKAFRYFLFRREDYFKGKLPVVIAIIALIISIISVAMQYLC